ncbi:hypothetical protein I302_100064 [Kwoniella bestiolae CBS 10118]|uniref:F-box domain-containing protein n=1 Tax=Kwoniella bestiolae CBS 10118 TaxID=1296100 RepID=A0A1B9G423_9TREE|nr:hypothetical protein I302_03436 [Kwoniella bestiolae CBS 10118]OCF25763.1 hypothetical protein I302_03436 [Kwoniella bestiolae CBS 10118]
MPDPLTLTLSPQIKPHPTLTPSTISPISISSPMQMDLDTQSTSSVDPLEALVELMASLPPELTQQIWTHVLSHPSCSLKLSISRTCKANYKKIIPQLYRHITLSFHNCQAYFQGLGPSFGGPAAPERWPVSGPGIMPLHSIGLSYDPSSTTSPFIRKFTLCNLVESVVISDMESLMCLLKAGGETWKIGMNTWRDRVMFDQIDSISFGSPIFTELDRRPLMIRGLLREVWNTIKSDSIIVHFPAYPDTGEGEILKEDTYRIAIDMLGTPQSLGQENRLLAELVVYTPQLDGIDLNGISASRVKIVLIGRNNWIACGSDGGSEKVENHRECLSQEAQLRRFVRRHWLVGVDNTEYIGIPQEVEHVSILNIANYNRRRCVTGRITAEHTYQAEHTGEGHDSSDKISLPTILYSALEGDEQLAREVNERVQLVGMEVQDEAADMSATRYYSNDDELTGTGGLLV